MESDDAIIGKEIGHCTIQRKLGQGGMGAVYLAHHPGLNRSVAIKILPGDLASNPEFKERFFREARLAARLEHPNVVQVHDVGEEQGIHYISMQYVEGESLDGVLKKRKKLSVNEALSLTKRVASALSAAAKLGIVHRDIKPHNILISKDGVVKVADFGLAKDEDANRSISEPGVVMGTPYYMSPEQARGEKVDHRSDIYSLGATLYHMLSGKRLFDGGTPVSIVMKQASERPVGIRELEPTLPEPVSALIDRMLQKDPAQRFASADELVRALDDLKQAAATKVPAPGAAAPPKRTAAMIALPLAGILLVGIVIGLVLRGGGKPPEAPPVAKAPPDPTPPPLKAPDPKPEPPKPSDPDPAPAKPFEKILSRLKDATEKKFTEEVMSRTEELLQAMKKKDLKAVRAMLDELAFGQMTDQQVAELFSKNHVEYTLESWEIQDVEIRSKMPGLRQQPHASVTLSYELKVPKGSLKIGDQPMHWIRKLDGRWYLTRLPKGMK
ncbi:MAG TPA: serine/threonine-protein kinase [Planctomycetota bacterium]|nr:serine/threonine-protein kinase [Planctomycetota bacterium]